MKATDLLKVQHKDVKTLFKQIENADERSEKLVSFEELAHSLVAHDAIEREIFYPACEKDMGMTDLLGEALVEHGVVEFCLYEANQAQRDDDFDFKMTVLKEMVEHHVKEEEGEFFPKVEKALGVDRLKELALRMKARFEQVKGRDFRKPLHENLTHVLAGALKASNANAKRSPARTPPSANKRSS